MKPSCFKRNCGFVVMVFLIMCTGCTTGISPQNKKQAKAFINLGETYINEGQYTAALEELLKAEKLMPDDPILHNDLGLAYMGKEKLDLAIHHFEKAVKLSPDYAVAKNNLGGAYLTRKDWDAAILMLQDVADDILYGSPHLPLTNLGIAYYEKGNYKKATQHLQKALTARPEYRLAQYYLGRTYLADGKLSDARDILEKTSETDPKNPALLLEIGKVYRRLGDRKSAALALRAAIEGAKDSDIAVQAAEELRKIYP